MWNSAYVAVLLCALPQWFELFHSFTFLWCLFYSKKTKQNLFPGVIIYLFIYFRNRKSRKSKHVWRNQNIFMKKTDSITGNIRGHFDLWEKCNYRNDWWLHFSLLIYFRVLLLNMPGPLHCHGNRTIQVKICSSQKKKVWSVFLVG